MRPLMQDGAETKVESGSQGGWGVCVCVCVCVCV